MNFPGLELAWNSFHGGLTALGAIRPWTMPQVRQSLGEGGKVLVVASTALGDSLLCTPLLQTLAHHLGRERVGFVVRSFFAELYEDTPWIGEVIPASGKFRGLGAIRSRAAKSGYKIALIANCTEPDFVPWLWWCGARGFLRYRTRWSRWANWFANPEMMRKPADPDYATGHAIENNLAMAEAMGLAPTTRHLRIHLPAKPAPAWPPLVLIHPGASRAGKCWPLENWAHVAGKLGDEFACQFGITGGPSERGIAAELAKMIRIPCQNFAGKLGLRELAQKQRSAALFLSGDTGPYHLAVAAGCPTVTLFAPRDRGSSVEACGPHLAPPEAHRALQTPRFNEPITSIPVEAVLAEARQIMGADRIPTNP